MNRVKKTFDGKYLGWYHTLKTKDEVTLFQLEKYTPVLKTIEELPWEGEGKNAICSKILQIDGKCDQFYETVTCRVNKTKIVNEVLFPELKLLKEKIEAYNQSIDDYNKINSQLQYEKSLVAKMSGENGTI